MAYKMFTQYIMNSSEIRSMELASLQIYGSFLVKTEASQKYWSIYIESLVSELNKGSANI